MTPRKKPLVDQEYALVAVDSIKPHPSNPRRGNVDAITDSIRTNGFRGALLVQKRTKHILAGNHRWQAAQVLGMTEVPVVWVDVSDKEAKRILLADNRTADLGEYDHEMLGQLLSTFDVLTGTGYSTDDLDDLLISLTIDAESAKAEIDNGTGAEDGTLSHNVDVYFNASPVLGKIATAMGFLPGIISKSVTKSYLDQIAALSMEINFVDNEFKDYDHDKHLDAVRTLRPKYATVRDVMTRSQCEAADIDYYPLDRILEMAAEINEFAENVMIIPKFDCIDQIPEQFMLGYSIPTAYGATPISLEAFRGRRTHLLGGNWKRQRNALAILGEDVVSLDNNHLMNIARWGQCYDPTGRSVTVAEVMPGYYGNVVAMMLSMSAIVADLSRSGCRVNGRKFLSKEDPLTVPDLLPADFDYDESRGDDD